MWWTKLYQIIITTRNPFGRLAFNSSVFLWLVLFDFQMFLTQPKPFFQATAIANYDSRFVIQTLCKSLRLQITILLQAIFKPVHCQSCKLQPQSVLLELTLCVIKHFTIVVYDSKIVGLGNCAYYDPRVVMYARKMFIRLVTGSVTRKNRQMPIKVAQK